jgi:hypothetical protein
MDKIYETLTDIEKQPRIIFRGTESDLLRQMVENGLLEQTVIENGMYRFSLTAIGFFALDRVSGR